MLRVAILAVTLAAVGAFACGSAAAAGAPMADAGLDQTVTVETTVQLDGSGSGHPNGPLSGYEWTIRTPDGREIEPDCPDCDRTQFTPSAVGRYEVTLAVTGPDGAESTDTTYVYVDDAGPDVSLSGAQTPDPDEPVTYTATAESPDAELAEIAWAVEDEIVAVRSLDGTADGSELSLAFTDAETHRVQVVVRDSNGRTAYDQLYVQPSSESNGPSSWSEVEPLDCSDSGYAARNSEECWDVEIPESTPEEGADESNDDSHSESFEARYVTDGYESDVFLGMQNTDSSYLGRSVDSVGLDDGENAPWNRGVLDRTYDNTVGDGLRVLFGQEQRTVTCEVRGGEFIDQGCAEGVFELENTGTTSHARSPTGSGSYSEYGLEGGERIRGVDPTQLEEGQVAEVTIVIQQEEDGIVDDVLEEVDSSAERVREGFDGLLGDDEGTPTEPNDRGSSNDASRTASGWNIGGSTAGRLVSGDENHATSGSQTSPNTSTWTVEDSESSNDSESPSLRNEPRLVE